MNKDLLIIHAESGIVSITVNRPELRNAFSTPLMEAMCKKMDEMKGRQDVKVLIVTGAGSSFSSGRDLKESAAHTKEQAERFMLLGERWSTTLRELPIPTIAAVNGPAFGWGMVLMLSCDIRLAAGDAVLGYPETALGVFPGGDATVRLTRQTFVPAAKDLVLTGRRFDAREGYRLGLVNRVTSKKDLLRETKALANEIAQHPLEKIKSMKSTFLKVEAMPRFGHLSVAENIDR
ncbi:MAG: enoyl-CoA hydratase/isomerase family protein [Nitrospinae bacterium]|nr:enoyl-CoA hydratase/isomerase family protein [Nitrospinota bacterium]